MGSTVGGFGESGDGGWGQDKCGGQEGFAGKPCKTARDLRDGVDDDMRGGDELGIGGNEIGDGSSGNGKYNSILHWSGDTASQFKPS